MHSNVISGISYALPDYLNGRTDFCQKNAIVDSPTVMYDRNGIQDACRAYFAIEDGAL
jgi:hypothetical protein